MPCMSKARFFSFSQMGVVRSQRKQLFTHFACDLQMRKLVGNVQFQYMCVRRNICTIRTNLYHSFHISVGLVYCVYVYSVWFEIFLFLFIYYTSSLTKYLFVFDKILYFSLSRVSDSSQFLFVYCVYICRNTNTHTHISLALLQNKNILFSVLWRTFTNNNNYKINKKTHTHSLAFSL